MYKLTLPLFISLLRACPRCDAAAAAATAAAAAENAPGIGGKYTLGNGDTYEGMY